MSSDYLRKIVAGYLFVTCKGSSCSKVLKKAKKLSGYRDAFRLEKGAGADIVINMMANTQGQILEAEKTIGGIPGVKEVKHRVGLI